APVGKEFERRAIQALAFHHHPLAAHRDRHSDREEDLEASVGRQRRQSDARQREQGVLEPDVSHRLKSAFSSRYRMVHGSFVSTCHARKRSRKPASVFAWLGSLARFFSSFGSVARSYSS